MADAPWDDFKPKQAVGAPPPPVDNPTPEQAAVQTANGPWKDFAVATKPNPAQPVPDGWTVETETDRVGNRYATSPDGKTSINIGGADSPDAPDTHQVTVNDPQHTSVGGAAWRGIQDAVPFIDYIKAGGNEVGSALGLNDTDMSYGDRVRAFQQQRSDSEAGDKTYHPIAHYGSEIAGLLAGGAAAKGLAGAAGVSDVLANSPRLQAMLGAGAQGAAYGAGEADPSHIVSGAVTGGAAGAAVGGAAPTVANWLGAPLKSIMERTGISGAVDRGNRGVNAMLRRAPQEADAVQARADAMRAAGQNPAILDVVDQSGRDQVAAANIKAPDAREATVEYARQRSAALPQDTERLIQQNVSPSTMTTPELRNQVAATQRHVNSVNYAALDPQTVPLDDAAGVKEMLNSPVGKQAMNVARQGNADVAKQVGKLSSWAQTPEYDAATHMTADQKATMKQLTDLQAKMPPAHAAALQPEIDKAAADFQAQWENARPNAQPPTDVTYEAVDKVRKAARKLAKSAEGTNGTDTLGLPGDYGAVADALDSHLSANVPGHDEAKAAHGAYSRVLNAIDGSGSKLSPGGGSAQPRVNGSDLVDQGTAQRSEGNYQNFEPWARNLSDEQLPLHNPDGSPILDRNGNQVTISQQDAARASAANAMRVRSQAPAPARSQARNFTDNNAQDIKSRALIGDTNADRLSAGLGATGTRADNANELAGRRNSPTARLSNDASELGEVLHTAGTVASAAAGHVGPALGQLGSMMRRAALNPSDAADLVNRAIDDTPGTVDAFITHLRSQGVSQQRARVLFNVARRAAAATAAGRWVPGPAPNTDRTITLTGR